jgi:hypothetical protein
MRGRRVPCFPRRFGDLPIDSGLAPPRDTCVEAAKQVSLPRRTVNGMKKPLAFASGNMAPSQPHFALVFGNFALGKKRDVGGMGIGFCESGGCQ